MQVDSDDRYDFFVVLRNRVSVRCMTKRLNSFVNALCTILYNESSESIILLLQSHETLIPNDQTSDESIDLITKKKLLVGMVIVVFSTPLVSKQSRL